MMIIFSVCQGKSAKTDALNTQYVGRALTDEGIRWSPLRGRYKGTDELSFALQLDDQSEIFARSYAQIFNQETILMVDGTGIAYICPPDDDLHVKGEIIGRWTKVEQQEAEAGDASTFDVNSGVYYVVKK